MVVRAFQKRGITIKTATKVTGHEPNGTGTRVLIEGGEPLDVEAVVVSVGRKPYADGLGLLGTSVKIDDRGFVAVDEWCRTGEPGVYAVGDLINTPQLAHVGFAEAIMVVKDILGESPMPVMYDRVPWAIYCHPEVAFAGYSEDAAKEAGYDVVTSKHSYRSNSRAIILNEADGLVKVIAEKCLTVRAGGYSAYTWWSWVTEQLGQGYLRSTGKRRSPRSASSSSRIRRCRRRSARQCSRSPEGACTADGRRHDAPTR
jgi:dihydrolipoamide dehydrogenase